MAAGRVNPLRMANESCRTDDVALMTEAIATASQPGSRTTAKEVKERGLKRSAARGSTNVLSYILDSGVDIHALTATDLMATEEALPPRPAVLDKLVGAGWDINTRGPLDAEWPLLWFVLSYANTIRWCLDHGAQVRLPDGEGTPQTGRQPPPLLELAASSSTVQIFDLLRARGAPVAPLTLHKAVEHAALHAPRDGRQSAAYAERLDMVRHLIDDLRLDVNSEVRTVGHMATTPLAYVADRPLSQDPEELTRLLLDRGADPSRGDVSDDGMTWPSAMTLARQRGNEKFTRIIKEWQAQHLK